MVDPLNAKQDQLRQLIRRMQAAVVCYSGGVDSTFLLKVAVEELGDGALALTAESPSLPQRELAQARDVARSIGAQLLVRRSNELARADYVANPSNRCFHCKTELMGLARQTARERGIPYILVGTNADDLGGHRPGLAAANEGGACHPLAEVGLTKQEIRDLSRQLGLPTWDKPEMACLASRFPYGTPITDERLQRVERFEAALADLGFEGIRVRFHDTIARLELLPEQMARAVDPAARERIVAAGRELGFAYVALDLAGYRRGAMNEVLPELARAPDAEQVSRATGAATKPFAADK